MATGATGARAAGAAPSVGRAGAGLGPRADPAGQGEGGRRPPSMLGRLGLGERADRRPLAGTVNRG